MIRIGFVLLLMLAYLTAGVQGQVRAVDKAEYDKLEEARSKAGKTSRIYSQVSTVYKSGKPTRVTRSITEFESPQRERTAIYVTEAGVRKPAIESIRYDGRKFEREGPVRWREIVNKPGGSQGFGSFKVGEELPNLEQFAVGKVLLDNKLVTLYSHYQVYVIDKAMSFQDHRMFVNSDGLIVREISKFSMIYPTNVTNVIESTYKYDIGKLNIEIPDSYDVEER